MSDATLELVLDIAIFMVVAGVVLEGAEYIEDVRQHGWQLKNPWKLIPKIGFTILIVGLAGEWYASTIIHGRDADRITSLSPRRLTTEQVGAIEGPLYGYSDKIVRVQSYALDAESAVLGRQIEVGLSPAVHVDDNLMSLSALGALSFGVHVTGRNGALVAAIISYLEKVGLRPSRIPPVSGTGMSTPSPIPDDAIDATVFVGVKPIAE